MIAVDFDGVLHDYSFARDGLIIHKITGPAIPGAIEWLARLYIDDRVDVSIHSFRSRSLFGRWAMQQWMFNELVKLFGFLPDPNSFFENAPLHEGIYGWIKWPRFKPYAHVYLDDKAWCFTGQWPDIDSMVNFKAWNK